MKHLGINYALDKSFELLIISQYGYYIEEQPCAKYLERWPSQICRSGAELQEKETEIGIEREGSKVPMA